MPSAPDRGPRRLRADAATNRDRIVEAARTVFARDGVAAPLTAVALEAGVGIATLYRRFPERDDLVSAAFGEAMRAYEASALEALEATDPWEGFAGIVTRMGEIEARNRGFTHIIQSQSLPVRRRAAEVDPGYLAVVEVVRRAHDAGVLRPEVTADDLPVISFAVAGILETTRDDVPDAWRRHVALVLDGCRAGSGTGAALPPPPDPRALQRAMIRSTRRRQSR
jgi:AcrR family transcriptional regulator